MPRRKPCLFNYHALELLDRASVCLRHCTGNTTLASLLGLSGKPGYNCLQPHRLEDRVVIGLIEVRDLDYSVFDSLTIATKHFLACS